jgi:hypothetical protein
MRARRNGQHRRLAIICVILLTAGVASTSGCSSTPNTHTGATSRTSEPPTSRTNSAPSSSPLPAGDAIKRGPATVYSGCTDKFQQGDSLTFSDGQVFDPARGKNVLLPKPTVPPGKKLVRHACTVGGDENHIRVYYVFTVSTPPSGLTPESRETSIVSFDPFKPDDNPVATAAWPTDLDVTQFSGVAPTYYGFMVMGKSIGGDGSVVGFDPDTLQVDWRGPGEADLASANFEGYVRFDRAGGTPDECRYAFHSAKDGSQVGTELGTCMTGGITTFPTGFILIAGKTFPYTFGYFNMQTRQFETPVPSGGVMWKDEKLSASWARGRPSIEVWDAGQNKLMFSRYDNDVEGLHIKSVRLSGKYLYIENDADSPVIDITTSQKVSSGWNTRPTDFINRDWVLVLPGKQGPSSCFQDSSPTGYSEWRDFGCPRDVTLVRAPDGQYAGPWF